MSSWLDFFQTMAILKMNDKIAQQNEQLLVLNKENNSSLKFTKDIHKLANQLDSLGLHNEADSLHKIFLNITKTSLDNALKVSFTFPDKNGDEVLNPHLLDKVNKIINNLQIDHNISISQNSNIPIKTMNTKFSDQFDIKLETNSWDNETFIYLTREYKDGLCLNQNEIGVGKSDDPLRRWKEHNTASSKSTVQINFEYIWLVKYKEYEKDLHKKLKKAGFKNSIKEIFNGTDINNNTLTIELINSIIKKDAIDGPWTIVNGKILKANEYEIIKNQKEIELIKKNFIDSKTYNPAYVKIIKEKISDNKLRYDELAPQYKSNYDIVLFCTHHKFIETEKIPDIYKFDYYILKSLFKNGNISWEYIENNKEFVFDSLENLNNEEAYQQLLILNDKLIVEKIKQKQIDEDKFLIDNILSFEIKNMSDKNLVLRNKRKILELLSQDHIIAKLDINILRLIADDYNAEIITKIPKAMIFDNKFKTNDKLDLHKIKKAIRKNDFFHNVLIVFWSSLILVLSINFIIYDQLKRDYVNPISLSISTVFSIVWILTLLISHLFFDKRYFLKKVLSTSNDF